MRMFFPKIKIVTLECHTHKSQRKRDRNFMSLVLLFFFGMVFYIIDKGWAVLDLE